MNFFLKTGWLIGANFNSKGALILLLMPVTKCLVLNSRSAK